MIQPKIASIQFIGGASTVTGSKTLLECAGKRILVDCGLFQGLKELRLLNRKPFPVDPNTIDAVVLTHAHLDHSGYIPLLVKNGFKGPIHCTYPTMDLTSIILRDSGKIQEEDAERANRHQYSKHNPAQPLYTRQDAENCLDQFIPHNLNEWVILNNEFKFQFLNSGHILGSAFIDMKVGSKKFIFSGDIGRKDPMLLYPPKKLREADYIIMESTYGDRIHKIENVKEVLAKIIDETIGRGGILMIPTFAVERTQEIIFLLNELGKENRLPKVPIYLDSPMGIESTNVFDNYPTWQDLSKRDTENMFDCVKFIKNSQQSKAIVLDKKSKIVLAGSGMISGGRIIHYLNNHMDNPKNTLLFVGFQAIGTRGRDILEGEKQIKFFGELHEVKCDIQYISSLSGHADKEEIMEWLGHFHRAPEHIFINHGEPKQSEALRKHIQADLKWNCTAPLLNERFEIEV